MKINYIFFALVITLLSCHQARVKNDNKESLIVGQWVISQTIAFQNNDDSKKLVCNVCLKIKFVKDHSGSIGRADAHILAFNWKIDRDELEIKHTNEDKDDIISNGTYKIIIDYKKSHQEIALLDTSKSIKYILRK
jgi:hypothetical protein